MKQETEFRDDWLPGFSGVCLPDRSDDAWIENFFHT